MAFHSNSGVNLPADNRVLSVNNNDVKEHGFAFFVWSLSCIANPWPNLSGVWKSISAQGMLMLLLLLLRHSAIVVR